MPFRGEHSGYGHAFFLTFSCYKRRRILDEDALKMLVVETLASQLTRQKGKCQGFVIMPDHVHALVWFPEPDQLREFMKQWKRLSSLRIKRNLREHRTGYLRIVNIEDPVWQEGYYGFNIYSDGKMKEKLDYMHRNPVKAGLVVRAEQWRFGSARYYACGEDVGVVIEQPG
ncbi:MAG: transposase [Thermodesulfobacteriota bacterium]